MDPRQFTMHPSATQRARAEADWLDDWCEEIKQNFRYMGM